MAVLAVSGCVAVQPGPAPESTAPVGRTAPVVEPHIVQGPAREVLEAPPPAETTAPAAPPATRARDTPREPSVPPPRPPRTPTAGPPAVPSLPLVPSVPVSGPDVCALGEGYGSWRPGSPQARICRKVYGN